MKITTLNKRTNLKMKRTHGFRSTSTKVLNNRRRKRRRKLSA